MENFVSEVWGALYSLTHGCLVCGGSFCPALCGTAWYGYSHYEFNSSNQTCRERMKAFAWSCFLELTDGLWNVIIMRGIGYFFCDITQWTSSFPVEIRLSELASCKQQGSLLYVWKKLYKMYALLCLSVETDLIFMYASAGLLLCSEVLSMCSQVVTAILTFLDAAKSISLMSK